MKPWVLSLPEGWETSWQSLPNQWLIIDLATIPDFSEILKPPFLAIILWSYVNTEDNLTLVKAIFTDFLIKLFQKIDIKFAFDSWWLVQHSKDQNILAFVVKRIKRSYNISFENFNCESRDRCDLVKINKNIENTKKFSEDLANKIYSAIHVYFREDKEMCSIIQSKKQDIITATKEMLPTYLVLLFSQK